MDTPSEELLELHQRRAARKCISADDCERLEWYGMDRDFDPEYLDIEECREIAEAYNAWPNTKPSTPRIKKASPS